MKQPVKFVISTLACCCLFYSCVPLSKYKFYNNSEHTVKTLIYADIIRTRENEHDATIAPSSISKPSMIHVVEKGHNVTLDNFWRFAIQTEKTNWIYCITNYLPHEYNQAWGLFGNIKRFQIEPTGEIYVLKPTEEFPLKDFNNQPPGFPLKPINQPFPSE